MVPNQDTAQAVVTAKCQNVKISGVYFCKFLQQSMIDLTSGSIRHEF